MTTHPSCVAWKTPWTEEPGGLYPVKSQRVRHLPLSLSLSLSLTHTHTHTQVLKKARNAAESVLPGLEDSLYSDFQSDTEEDIQLLRQIKCSY